MRYSIYLAAVAGLLIGTAQATPPNTPWSGQCSATDPPSVIGCQPQAETPIGTNLLLVWEIGQHPKTRALQVQQVLNAGLPVTATTGAFSSNVTITGSLGVTGPTTLGALTAASSAISGNATVGGSFDVNGPTNLAALGATSGAFSGGVTIGTTLDVTGPTNLAALSATNGTFSGNVHVSGSFGVTGPTNLGNLSSSSAAISGNATVGGSFEVTGPTTLTGNLTAGSAHFTANITLDGTLVAHGAGTTSSETGWDYNVSGGTAFGPASVSYVFDAGSGGYRGGNYYSTSDRRLKSDISPISPSEGLRWLSLAAPKTYIKGGSREAGFIAQDQARTYPQYVAVMPHVGLPETIDQDGFKSKANLELDLNYNNYVPYLTAALQGALERISILEGRVAQRAGMSKWQR